MMKSLFQSATLDTTEMADPVASAPEIHLKRRLAMLWTVTMTLHVME